MKIILNENNKKATIELSYSFSKLELLTFKVKSLEPDKLPIINIHVNKDNENKDYRIDLIKALTDEMELPIFEVYSEFPITDKPSMTISRNNDYIEISLEKGDYIEIECNLKGGSKLL